MSVATVDITCLCGAIRDSLLLDSQLPVKTSSCSCNICRYCSGVLYLSVLPLKERPAFVDKLREYQSSPRVSRFFCGTCGSHVLCRVTKGAAWGVCSGVVERLADRNELPMQLEQYIQHEFIGDTVDGGLMICLAELDGKAVPFFLQGPDEAPVTVDPSKRPSGFLPLSSGPVSETASSEKLFAGCHCGGVQFNITRPTTKSAECSSPWPDLLVPYHSHGSENPKDVKWWLRAGASKYLAGTCACRSCRLAAGVPIQTWAFVPKVNIQKPDGSPLDFFDFGALRQYNSSQGCYREFCGTCGASVFWHCDERPDLIDVSVGLLRAPEGSRAEKWLEWWMERVSFKEDALDAALASRLEKGLQAMARS